MPHMVTEVTNLRGSLTADFKNLGDELKDEMGDLREAVEGLEARMKRGLEKQSERTKKMATVISSLTGVVGLIANGVFVTRLELPEDDTMQIDGDGPQAGIDTTGEAATQGDADGPASPQTADLPGMYARSSLLNFFSLPIASCASSVPASGPSASVKTAKPAAGRSLAALMQTAQDSADQISMSHMSEHDTDDAAQQSNSRSVPSASTPVFILESNHSTVDALWKEWYVGISGRLSIDKMVKKKLPKSEGQRKLYARRKIIINEISRLASEKVIPESEVVERLDEYRARSKLSITKLQDEIKRKRGSNESII